MAKQSAGLLVYRRKPNLEVFLVHPGGPFWVKKDFGSWTIPKGLIEPGEEPLDAARREFFEETGIELSAQECVPLGSVRQPSGKIVYAWAVEDDFDATGVHSNSFSMEWPPGSGREREFPEIDRGGWFSLAEARERIGRTQEGFLDALRDTLAKSP